MCIAVLGVLEMIVDLLQADAESLFNMLYICNLTQVCVLLNR